MPPQQYQSLDDLLAGAKGSLARANDLQRETAADARRMPLPTRDSIDAETEASDPIVHAGRSFARMILPTDRLSDIPEGISYAVQHPIDSASLLFGADSAARKAEAAKADETSGLASAGHRAASLLPFIGPGAASAGEDFERGDIAGGIGKTAGLLAPFLLHGLKLPEDAPVSAYDSPVEPGITREQWNARQPVHGPEPPPESFEPIPVSKYEGSGTVEPLAGSLADPTANVRHYMPNVSADTHVGDPEAVATPYQPVMERYAPNVSGYETTVGDHGRLPTPEAPDTPAQVPEPESEAPTKPRLSADDFLRQIAPSTPRTAEELAAQDVGRAKFAEANPEAAPNPELDRMGLEYTRTQSELKRLLGMEPSSLSEGDAADLPRYRQAARELGSRLRAGAKATTAPLETPPPSDVGPNPVPTSAHPSSLADMLRASVADSAAKAELPPNERAGHFKLPEVNVPDDVYAKLRADVAHLEPSPIAQPFEAPAAATAPSGPGVSVGGELITDPREPAHFYEPDQPQESPLTRFMGDETGSANVADMVAAARTPIDWDRVGNVAHDVQVGNLVSGPSTLGKIGASNLGSLLMKSIENAARDKSFTPLTNTARELTNLPAMASDFKDALVNGTQLGGREEMGAEPNRLQRLSKFLTRPIGALDATTRGVAERAGMTSDEAKQITQQQTPSSDFSKTLLNWQRKSTLAKFMAPTMRSGLNLLESGVAEPIKAAERLRTGTSANAGQDLAKVALATTAAVAGYKLSDKIDELPHWAQPLALASAGYYEVPAAVAYAFAHAPTDGVRASLQKLFQSIPLGEGLNPDPSAWAARVIPGPVRQANPDYWTGTQRKTHGTVEKIQSKIPGLAQLLRVKPQHDTPRPHRAQAAR